MGHRVLSFIRSYISGRSQKVLFYDNFTSMQSVKSGVPQGSVLGPLLFTCYLLPLELIFVKLNMSYDFHADDLVCFVYTNNNDSIQYSPLCKNGLMVLNTKKTEFMKIRGRAAPWSVIFSCQWILIFRIV